MGRFFDAVASLCGIRLVVNYEAQAAIEFEALADPDETGEYEFIVQPDPELGSETSQVDTGPLIDAVIADLNDGTKPSTISARFHNTIARMVYEVSERIRRDNGVDQVVLSGGVWQNMTLLHRTYDLLTSDSFKVYIHHQVPANDGGLALGQAVVAIHRLMS
jgi:hydrogenase maturation protein HypF